MLKVFCFHHAGGGVSSFWGWQRALGPDYKIVPVQLPGRDSSGGNAHPRDAASLLRALDATLGPQLTERHLLYGHSMGALIAYGLTRLRLAEGRRLPERLLVGACRAPGPPRPLSSAQRLPDLELAHRLLDFGGVPQSLTDDPEWLRTRVARVRRDLRLYDGIGELLARWPALPLPCPIEVFTGSRDPLVAVADAARWAEHTTAPCTLHVLPGGHFFPRESKADFFRRLGSVAARPLGQ